jgi:hypothetical protein
MRGSLLLATVALAACRPVTDIGDKIIGLTNPVLVGGIVLGSAPPADSRLRLAVETAGFTGFSDARLVVADALEFQDIDGALLPDAEVSLQPEGEDPRAMQPDEEGWFAPVDGTFVSYVPGRTLHIETVLPDRVNPGTVDIVLPDVAAIDVDPVHPPGRDLVVDLAGQDFDYAFAAVYDLEGNEVFSNAPATNDDIVDLVLPSTEPVETVTIPGDVLDDDLYVIGLAGLRRAPAENIEGLNEALTAVLAGRLSLFPMVSGSPMVVNALVLDVPAVDPALAPFLGSALPTGLAVELVASDLLLAGDPLIGADVTVNGAGMPEVDDGRYRIDGLAHDGTADVRVQADGITSTGGFDLQVPAATEAVVPATFPQGFDLFVTTPGGPWQAVLVTVYDLQGETWSNVPTTTGQWEQVMTTEAQMERARIPAVAFPAPGTYALAIAGLQTLPDTLTDVNPRFSQVMAGSVGFHTVTIE